MARPRAIPLEPAGFYDPPGNPKPSFPPLTSRDELSIGAWRRRKLPPRDYLSGDVICTTSRTLAVGPTGIGKTLFFLDWGAATAAGVDFLGWKGRRRARVMYLDGELPAETFKERMAMVGDRYGDDIPLFGYNRDVLGPEEMPPLNTEVGAAWLTREIDTVKPDLIVFDAIMSLLSGNMAEEESWAPMKSLVRQISGRRIAQTWLHHTGHDEKRSFGTKTREWEMDSVIMLSKLSSDDDAPEPSAAFRLEFTKSRHKTPDNFREFAPRIVRATETGFVSEGTAPQKERPKSEREAVGKALVSAYERLSPEAEKSAGFDGEPVRKVAIETLRDELKRRGFLDVDAKGHLTANGRSQFRRAKLDLIGAGRFAESDGVIWRIRAG